MENRTCRTRYVAPAIEVIEMEYEGVIAGIGSINNFGKGSTDPFGNVSARRGGRSTRPGSSLSDLEDMISNILTFEP